MKLRGVFRGTKLPDGQHTIGTKWVFKIEREADEPIETCKGESCGKRVQDEK
uniref:Reverse transcriptase Ty1/copia-type domain-containing protein n=1 Tax=Peronospora matthiolae TaxID=2874970 RepID=A0AAV1UDK3_9STRA